MEEIRRPFNNHMDRAWPDRWAAP